MLGIPVPPLTPIVNGGSAGAAAAIAAIAVLMIGVAIWLWVMTRHTGSEIGTTVELPTPSEAKAA